MVWDALGSNWGIRMRWGLDFSFLSFSLSLLLIVQHSSCLVQLAVHVLQMHLKNFPFTPSCLTSLDFSFFHKHFLSLLKAICLLSFSLCLSDPLRPTVSALSCPSPQHRVYLALSTSTPTPQAVYLPLFKPPPLCSVSAPF